MPNRVRRFRHQAKRPGEPVGANERVAREFDEATREGRIPRDVVAWGTYRGQRIARLSDEALRGCLWHAGHPTHPRGPDGYRDALADEAARRESHSPSTVVSDSSQV